MAKPIWGMIPPGGWHYYEADVKLTGYSLDDLYKTVENYRAENHLPLGDVKGDVNSYLCSNHPKYCHGVDMVAVTSVHVPTKRDELLQDITTWAKNILLSSQRKVMVTDDLAEQRAKICLGCKFNINWRSGCSSCITAADRLSASIRQARETKSSRVLGGCAKMRHDNRSAVFFDHKEFTKASDLPENCWLNI